MRQECCQRAGSVAMPLGTRIKFATSYKMALAGGLSATLPLPGDEDIDGEVGVAQILKVNPARKTADKLSKIYWPVTGQRPANEKN